MRYKDRDKLARDLREFADFIEEHGVELPIGKYEFPFKFVAWLYEQDDVVRATHGLHGAEKDWSQDNYIDLRKKFGTTVEIEFTIPKRVVCERKVVGQREVEEQIIPARTEDIYEWECKESLLAS